VLAIVGLAASFVIKPIAHLHAEPAYVDPASDPEQTPLPPG
jgi:hypothetical protein